MSAGAELVRDCLNCARGQAQPLQDQNEAVAHASCDNLARLNCGKMNHWIP